MLNTIKKILLQLVDDIDAGNSNITDEEALQLLDTLKAIHEPRVSKYQACEMLGISRATFDNLVRAGKLPRGTKQQGFKELSWKKSEIMAYATKQAKQKPSQTKSDEV